MFSSIFIFICIPAVAGAVAYYLLHYAPRMDFQSFLREVFPTSEVSFKKNASTKRLVQVFEIRRGEETLMAGYEGPIYGEKLAPDSIYLFVPSDQIVADNSFDLYANTFFNRLLVPHHGRDCGLPLSVQKYFILSKRSFHGVASYLQESNLVEVFEKFGEARTVTRVFACPVDQKNLYRKTPFGSVSGVGVEYVAHLSDDLGKQLSEHVGLLQKLVESYSDTSC